MKCPACSVQLVMSERHGIEIDYCPQCRGVWLDRGELDKIIERSATVDGDRPRRETDRHERRHDDDDDDDHRNGRRRGWFSELFD